MSACAGENGHGASDADGAGRSGDVEAYHPEQYVHEPFGLARRERAEESQGSAVSMARSEYRCWPPRRRLRPGVQAVTSPRRARVRL